MIAIFMFIILIVFVLLGAPISMAMAIGALAAIKYSGLDPVIIPSLISGGMSNYTLMAIPFFIFLGNIMNSGGITERIFDWCEALVGHMKGSLAQVNVVTARRRSSDPLGQRKRHGIYDRTGSGSISRRDLSTLVPAKTRTVSADKTRTQ